MFLGGIYYSVPAIEVAHQHGYHVITVDYLPGNIAHKYSDEFHNVSILDKDAILHLAKELQRLFSLLQCKTGIYNIETRVCKNGKAYIMEVSPRAGGNRIAEIQQIGTGVKLIEAEICKAVNDPIPEIKMPEYHACYMVYAVHSLRKGYFQAINFQPDFKSQHYIDLSVYLKKGDFIEPFTGANKAIGNVLLKFKDRKECNTYLSQLTDYIKVDIN